MDNGRGGTSTLLAEAAWSPIGALQSQATFTTRTPAVWPDEFKARVSCCEAACNEVIPVQAHGFVSAAWLPCTRSESSEQGGPNLDNEATMVLETTVAAWRKSTNEPPTSIHFRFYPPCIMKFFVRGLRADLAETMVDQVLSVRESRSRCQGQCRSCPGQR